jgi:[acyl-carrier-protein] S-malonyltransferase
VQNVDARVATDTDELRNKLLQQISRPVLWTSCVQTMVGHGVTRLAECGPGRVLAGLVKRIDKNVEALNLGSLDGFDAALAAERAANG